MVIKPKVGIDEIAFGTSKAEIIEMLGKPDRIGRQKICGNPMNLYIYNQKMVTFWFNSKDELEMIDTSYPETYLENKKIIGASKKKVKKILGKRKYQFTKYRKYRYREQIFCEELYMDIWFEFDRAVSLHIYV